MKWNKDMVKYLTENYHKMSIDEIAEVMNLTRKSITCKASRLGLTKKENGNINIFENINTEESAYWLGFIYADGYIEYDVSNSKRGTNYALGIELNEKDIHHLEKFSNIFNNYYKIITRERSMNNIDIFNNREITNRTHKLCCIRIYSKKIVNDLIKNNIVKNKTHSDIFPRIEDKEMFLHFLRGYIDGDGSYVISDRKDCNTKRLMISITGNNKECFEYISKKLMNDFNINSYITNDREHFKLSIYKNENVLTLIDLMYNNAKIYLDRKYEKINYIKAVFSRNIKDN